MYIKTAHREGGLFCVDLYWYQCIRVFTIPSSKRKTPDLLRRSGLRTTGTRQHQAVIHIGRYSTRKVRCVNGFGLANLQALPIRGRQSDAIGRHRVVPVRLSNQPLLEELRNHGVVMSSDLKAFERQLLTSLERDLSPTQSM